MTTPFPMIEKAVRQLIEAKYPEAADKVGGDPDFDPASVDLFVMLSLVPGGGTTQTDGEWIVDVDVFGRSYSTAMTHALALEAALVGPRHITELMRIDNCYQNEGPAERPWDDDNVYRIGATYVFTARRSG